MARKRKATPDVHENLAQEKHFLVIDRFATWCRDCKSSVTQAAKSCRTCGATFTHVTTECPLEWMPSVIQNVRPDLIFEK